MSQATDILDHIDKFGSITDAEAASYYSCYRLSARIYDLRALGIDIKTEKFKGVNKFGRPFCCARYTRG